MNNSFFYKKIHVLWSGMNKEFTFTLPDGTPCVSKTKSGAQKMIDENSKAGKKITRETISF